MAEYTMTMALIVGVFLVVCQFAYATHVRSTLTMAAAESARYGARVDAGPGVAQERASDLVSDSLSPRYAGSISAHRSSAEGLDVIQVDIDAPVPVLGPFGVGLTLHTSGRAIVEERSS
ncbi:TadE family protein [Dermacoccus sp. PE3]|uniref:TadE family protein n=1 Tax=Dermacoccus sp. PE3 TaxID=1641401 RepID=UPI0018CFDDF7|nr:TadE family protein [Dermacoccus sp. PE3]